MSAIYNPDASAEISGTLYTALLSQRDLATRVPINYATAPGIQLTSVCFSDKIYEDTSAQKCLSNLLSAGFHRFVIDLYWDESRQTWSLCPVELATLGNSSSPVKTGIYSTSLSTSSSSTSPAASLSVAQISGQDDRVRERAATQASTKTTVEKSRWALADFLYPRQTTGSSISESANASPSTIEVRTTPESSTATVTSGSPTASLSATHTAASGLIHNIGPYYCTTDIGISTFADVFANFFSQTENNVNATFKQLEFNIHSASPFDDPTGTAAVPELSRLPGTGNYLGELLNTSLSSYIYTPYALSADRANLNQTWFAVEYRYQPLAEYFTTERLPGSTDLYTPNGWPSESYAELNRALRFVAGVGTVDPQMKQYDFSTDIDTIFPPGYILSSVDVTLSSDGNVTSGCFFEPNITSLSEVNSSWAISSNLPNTTDLSLIFNSATNISACGISPILNEMIENKMATTNGSVYLNYIRRTIWSWADGEPSTSDDDDDDDNQYHCAIANLSNVGRWQVADCTDNHYAACRLSSSPYEWVVSHSKNRYGQMDGVCDDGGSKFGVPRTALENAYMLRAMQDWVSRQDGDDDDDDSNTEAFWLNLNDLDIEGCWVSGVNQTCPYRSVDRHITRKIVAPTVAAVIVFVLAILTILVKCAANRRNTRRGRKRGEGGWDYEGVPS